MFLRANAYVKQELNKLYKPYLPALWAKHKDLCDLPKPVNKSQSTKLPRGLSLVI